jgi:hypothetical protein
MKRSKAVAIDAVNKIMMDEHINMHSMKSFRLGIYDII